MTSPNNLSELKKLAKQIARARRIKLVEAQNSLALDVGYPHWPGLIKALKAGWTPTKGQMEELRNQLLELNPSARSRPDEYTIVSRMLGDDKIGESGSIGEHPYRMEAFLDDVYIFGRGWSILVREAPSAEPVLEITDKSVKENPLNDPEFVSKALAIASAKAEQIRAMIAADWPRRSTKPDAEGRARHPLFDNTLSAEWYCLHCDGKFSSSKIAVNMWHCPDCHASPMDIFPRPFWLDEEAS